MTKSHVHATRATLVMVLVVKSVLQAFTRTHKDQHAPNALQTPFLILLGPLFVTGVKHANPMLITIKHVPQALFKIQSLVCAHLDMSSMLLGFVILVALDITMQKTIPSVYHAP